MLGFLIRAAGLGLLVLALGCAALTMVARSALGDTAQSSALFARIARLGMFLSLALVVIAFGRLYLQLDAMRFPGEPLLTSLEPLFVATTWGKAWMAQVAFLLVGAAAFGAAIRARAAIAVAALSLTIIAATFALSGHAAAVEERRAAVIGADTLHIVAAGAWIGSIALIVMFWRVLRETGGTARVVAAFSPVALSSAGLLALSGAIGSLAHIPTVSDLFGARYGQILLLKLALVAGVVVLGWFNWKRNAVRLATDDGDSLRKGAIAELVVAVAVILVTTVLIVTPPPAE